MNHCRRVPAEDAGTARRRLTTAVAGSALACLLATGAGARTTTAGPGSLDGCLRASRTTTLVTFGVGGANSERLRAGIVGKGRNALVLANQAVPALVAVSQGDPYSAQDSPALERAFGSAHKRLVLVPGAAHGLQLHGGEPSATVAAAVYSFLQPFGSSHRPPSLSGECGSAVAAGARGARAIAFTAGDGTALHGHLIGHGGTAVVLAHEWPNSLCGWFPYAAELGHAGFRVLLFDHRTKGMQFPTKRESRHRYSSPGARRTVLSPSPTCTPCSGTSTRNPSRQSWLTATSTDGAAQGRKGQRRDPQGGGRLPALRRLARTNGLREDLSARYLA
jgi:hypothetical protein